MLESKLSEGAFSTAMDFEGLISFVQRKALQHKARAKTLSMQLRHSSEDVMRKNTATSAASGLCS